MAKVEKSDFLKWYCSEWDSIPKQCTLCQDWLIWHWIWDLKIRSYCQLENVALVMHCNLKPPDATPVLIRFNFIARVKYEVAQSIRCCLRTFLLLIGYITLWSWTLIPWPWPLTLNICSIPAVPWSNSVLNLSAIEQSTAELVQFEYLTLWPWTFITCCAMLCDSLQFAQNLNSVKLSVYEM